MDRKAIAESLRGQEYRTVAVPGFELREVNGAPILTGHASVTETPYDMGSFSEVVKRGAFTTTLSQTPDVQLLVNHTGLPLARTLSGTLRLAEDDRGLRVDATLNPDDPDVQRLLPKVQRGDLDQMSFSFRAVRQRWSEDYDLRELLEVSLSRGDVSVVNQGASPTTSFTIDDARQFLAELSKPEFEKLVRSTVPEPGPPRRFRTFEEYKREAAELRRVPAKQRSFAQYKREVADLRAQAQ